MAVGQNANVGFNSYVAIGREATFKTYSTCTAGIDFLSAGLKTVKDGKILETISTKRTHADRISLGKSIEGDIELYMAADSDGCQYLMQNAFGGGTVSSATATGDTATGAVFDHTYSINNFDATYSSLCINMRKGDSTSGKIFEYSGVRVNEMTLSGEIDEALKTTFSVVACNSTVTANSVAASLTVTGQTPLSFVDMRFSVETSVAALTTTSYWHVQSFEFGIANNLKADASSRRLGSDTLDVLPAGVATFTLNASIRFDTTTAFDAMVNATQLSVQMQFLGATLSGSTLRQAITLNLPRVYVADAGDPEVSGPDEILVSEVSFNVLRDDTTSTGYAVQAVVRNKTASY